MTDADVQRRTNNILLGKNGENVRDLIDSFRKNGFLPVDQIQVRQLGSGKYLVVEGNRRVAALKLLQVRYEHEGYDLGNLNPEIFSKLPVVFYTGVDDTHHLVLMGLKHISGNKKWPAINQAELLRTLYEKHGMIADDICKAIGISKREFNATLSTLALIDQYKESDYGDQFTSEKYSFFREIVRSRNLREWLQWNDSQKQAGMPMNLERLFSWLSEEEVIDDDDEAEQDIIGNSRKLEPVITKASQIRELAKLIDDQKALGNLDASRNLAEATLASEVLSKDKVKNALSIINQEVGTIFNMSRHISDADRSEIGELSRKLSGVIDIQNAQALSASTRNVFLVEKPRSHFKSINIKEFKKFEKVMLEDLTMVNLFAGVNNSGKTSILEAVALLTSLNSPRAFIDLGRRRSQLTSESLNVKWFIGELPEGCLEGVFDGKKVSLKCQNDIEEDIADQTYYLSSFEFIARHDGREWRSVTHFFEKYPQRTEGAVRSLCPVVFSSPFIGLEMEMLRECHDKSVEFGSKKIVVDFIRKHVDSGVQNIELVKDGRFRVSHNDLERAPDLTQFGAGMQRIFNIGLLFAGARNGVLLIDEIENAIHAAMLPNVVSLIDELSEKFYVQVFLTSHSKECIDAFARCDSIRPKLAAYALLDRHEKKYLRFDGERIARLLDSIDFDLRGGKKR
ncbi:AAA family ATPase [Desulfosarcina ovata]|uniref:AAA family ATPase n=1 Tax=Desulfosarcina ovata TaxID=83564 RepID=UPI0015630F0B|nr:AAA family ATPase [Desulfosarcina ovata]